MWCLEKECRQTVQCTVCKKLIHKIGIGNRPPYYNGRYTTNIPTNPHTVTTTDIKTNMLHIHASIVSRYLATRGNNKILRTHPPHISNSELVAPLPNSEQTNLTSSNHTYTKSTPKHIHHHYAPYIIPHSRHTSSLQLHPHTHHIVTPGFVDRPRRSDCTAGQMDGEAGWWTTSGNIGLPPLAKVTRAGRQQQCTVVAKCTINSIYRLYFFAICTNPFNQFIPHHAA